MDHDTNASQTAVFVLAACATLCVFWLCAGQIRRAVVLWLTCAVLFGAWYQAMLLPGYTVGALNAVVAPHTAAR